jgi:hypothetical protein
MSGPVPKRSDQRRSSAPPGRPITKAPAGSRVPVACPEPEERWHPQAVKWYSALAESGQAQFYEPSDWAQAALIAEGISRMLYADRLSAQMFTAVNDASVRLLVTEGDRRRARIELDRAGAAADADEDAAVTSMEAWREKLGG